MTTNEPKRPGYRGTLPEREDRLARTWLIIVGVIFVAIIVLSLLGVPSRFIPDATPVPLPTNPPTSTQSAAPTDSASTSPSPSQSPAGSPSEAPSPTGS
jgi:cytoskeletal protein RodZ